MNLDVSSVSPASIPLPVHMWKVRRDGEFVLLGASVCGEYEEYRRIGRTDDRDTDTLVEYLSFCGAELVQ